MLITLIEIVWGGSLAGIVVTSGIYLASPTSRARLLSISRERSDVVKVTRV